MKYLNFNGKIVEETTAFILPDNRSFRYGDGCFETIKMLRKKILLQDLHLTRLFTSLDQLEINVDGHFASETILDGIHTLSEANKLSNARIRITISRGNGSLHDTENLIPEFIIQQYPLLREYNDFNEIGLEMGIYRGAIKAADNFSMLKSNNFLLYAMAALWAKKQHLNDAFLLNQNGRLADSTIANMFIVHNGVIKTPALTEGCISGVMRKHLLSAFKKENLPMQEGRITVDDLLNASEVFITNAIRGIQWVRKIDSSEYTGSFAQKLYEQFITPINQS